MKLLIYIIGQTKDGIKIIAVSFQNGFRAYFINRPHYRVEARLYYLTFRFA